MKISDSQLKKEFEQRRQALEDAKKALGKAKSALKAKRKSLKERLKPLKQAYKQAENAEIEAKVAYKAFLKELKKSDEANLKSTEAEKSSTPTATETSEPKKRGRKPGTKLAPKADKPAGKRGRPKSVAATVETPSDGADDLTLVRGVGGKVADMLKANGVDSFAAMAATSYDRYKELLKESGLSQFRNPTNWAADAAALAGMEAPAPAAPKPAAEPTEPKKRGRKPGTKLAPKADKPAGKRGRPKATAEIAVAEAVAPEAEAPKKRGRKPGTKLAATANRPGPKKASADKPAGKRGRKKATAETETSAEVVVTITDAPKKRGRKPGTKLAETAKKPGRKPGTKNAAPAANESPNGGDDLTLVKGVGGRVAEALKMSGITTFADMAATSLERYKEILKENNMSKFRDPSKWAELAGQMAG